MRVHLMQVPESAQGYLEAQDQPQVWSKALGEDSFTSVSP